MTWEISSWKRGKFGIAGIVKELVQLYPSSKKFVLYVAVVFRHINAL